MNAPDSHNALQATPAARVCATCGGEYTPRTRHATRFCSDRCRMAFHGAEARVEKIKAKAVAMYQALAAIARGQNDPIGVNSALAAEAIKDLKPPVEPKTLLEKAKA